MRNAWPICSYSSRTLAKPPTRPVGLPCASCVWKSSWAGAGGAAAASPPPRAAAAASSLSTSLEVSLDLPFFLPRSRRGMARPSGLPPHPGWGPCCCSPAMRCLPGTGARTTGVGAARASTVIGSPPLGQW
uniref:Uncharacterized protein n=1 Tax=Chelydra serpentina TaxID=8475 RepID=A0A8C3SZQ2_CHESE